MGSQAPGQGPDPGLCAPLRPVQTLPQGRGRRLASARINARFETSPLIGEEANCAEGIRSAADLRAGPESGWQTTGSVVRDL